MGWIIIPMLALSIPIISVIFNHVQKAQNNKIKEMELQKEILKLEVEKQNGKIKLLEEENKNLDKIIYN